MIALWELQEIRRQSFPVAQFQSQTAPSPAVEPSSARGSIKLKALEGGWRWGRIIRKRGRKKKRVDASPFQRKFSSLPQSSSLPPPSTQPYQWTEHGLTTYRNRRRTLFTAGITSRRFGGSVCDFFNFVACSCLAALPAALGRAPRLSRRRNRSRFHPWPSSWSPTPPEPRPS